MEVFLFGNIDEEGLKFFHSGVLVYNFHTSIRAENGLCVGVLLGVTDDKMAVLKIFYVRDKKVRFSFAIEPQIAWFVPMVTNDPPEVYELAAKYAMREQWRSVSCKPPSYMWKHSLNLNAHDGV